ncbi:MAG: cytochrome c [Candidatus Kapabacteria bacterium]|nr:cytochrome c [Candidatus Kapabacteria bacterium]
MKNLKIVLSIFVVGMVLAFGNLSSTAQEGPDAKQIFIDKKCNSCHSIESMGIEKSNPKAKGTDLSKVGDQLTADFIAKYLKKEEALEGKKHGVAFKGSDEEFNALVNWLASLKAEPKSE